MTKICAFFGHRDTEITSLLEAQLENTIRNLINKGVTEFWCCDQGNFDWIARLTMLRLKEEYKHIYLCYISAYNPDNMSKTKQEWLEDKFEIIYPQEVANGHPRFAIERRNNYIAKNADVIVCYIKKDYGGAYKAVKTAQKYQKEIINHEPPFYIM